MTGGRTGVRNTETEFASAELYNPSTGTFTSAGNMSTARLGHTATLLNDGKVLVAGGIAVLPGPNGSTALATAELYNPTTGTFTLTGNTIVGRFGHAATLLNNGTVLLEGGCSCTGNTPFLASAELYSPAAGTFALTGNLNTSRAGEPLAATLLNSGIVLLAGGENGTATNGTILSSAELYEPGLPTLQSIAITPANPSIGVGTSQIFIATGTFSDGTTSPLASVIWTTSNSGVAPVSNDATNKGTAVGTAAGSTAITATVGSITNSTTLTVH